MELRTYILRDQVYNKLHNSHMPIDPRYKVNVDIIVRKKKA